MGLWLGGHIQIIFVVCLLWPVGAEGKVTGRATCESTGLGQPARVTCHYGENVVEAGDVRAVSLLHAADGKLEKVMECHRFSNNGFDCLPKAGYTLNGIISDQMMINIPRALTEHQGTYYCELGIQETEFQMERCDLEYEEPKDAATSTPPSEKHSDNTLKGDTGTSHVTGWLIAVTVLLIFLLVIALLIAVYLIVRWRHRRQRKIRQQDTDADKLKDTIANVLLASSNISIGDGPYKRNVGQSPYDITEVEVLVLDSSINDYIGTPTNQIGEASDRCNVGMTTKRPYNSELYIAAERTKSRTEENSQRGDHTLRWVTYNGSYAPLPQLVLKKSCTQSRRHLNSV